MVPPMGVRYRFLCPPPQVSVHLSHSPHSVHEQLGSSGRAMEIVGGISVTPSIVGPIGDGPAGVGPSGRSVAIRSSEVVHSLYEGVVLGRVAGETTVVVALFSL